MPTPLISVLVPVYNGGKFLGECLESILRQDFGDFELLISDDQSNDDSVRVIERFAQRDRRIRWWCNSRNLGIGGNFNACLKAARGEFVKYVLQDDMLVSPATLRRMVDKLQADPSVSLVVSACYLMDAESRLLSVRDGLGPSGVREGKPTILYCLEKDANLIGEPSLAMFRKCQAERGFDETLKQLLDLEMWFFLLEQGRLAYISEPLCAFRQHSDQQTEANRRRGDTAEENLFLLERYYFKPWMKQIVTPQAIFRQQLDLRRRRTERAVAVGAKIAMLLSRRRYFVCWCRHRLNSPFHNLRRWLRKHKFLR
jgi:glycosyltransferase involved in cell wall biosynthesis